MKILVVDDEQLVRDSLTSMIEEIGDPWELAGEAVNGEDMLEKVNILRPDAVLVDIKMPKLNGLEGIRKGKGVSPETHWIILSGYSQFEYAREALQLGASNYLLKPVDPDELRASLEHIEHMQARHQELASKQFEQDMFSLSHNMIQLDHIETEVDRMYFTGLIFYWDSFLRESEQSEILNKFYQAVRRELNDYKSKGLLTSFFTLPEGELTVIIASELVEREMKHHALFAKCLNTIKIKANEYSSQQFAITIFQTNFRANYKQLASQFAYLKRNAYLRFVLGLNNTWSCRRLSKYEDREDFINFANSFQDITYNYREGIYLNYMKAVDRFENLLSGNSTELDLPTIDAIIYSFKCMMNCTLQADHNLQQWVQSLRDFGDLLLTDLAGTDCTKTNLVDQVIAYIDHNFMNEIGIGQISLQLNVTPNYLSTLFRKKTGITFVKYLTNIRLLKAKELLADPNIQVQQAAEKVGYFSTRHFTKLFTEFTGCYPSDYKKKFI
jgi:two-component system response regulator YesN